MAPVLRWYFLHTCTVSLMYCIVIQMHKRPSMTLNCNQFPTKYACFSYVYASLRMFYAVSREIESDILPLSDLIIFLPFIDCALYSSPIGRVHSVFTCRGSVSAFGAISGGYRCIDFQLPVVPQCHVGKNENSPPIRQRHSGNSETIPPGV